MNIHETWKKEKIVNIEEAMSLVQHYIIDSKHLETILEIFHLYYIDLFSFIEGTLKLDKEIKNIIAEKMIEKTDKLPLKFLKYIVENERDTQ